MVKTVKFRKPKYIGDPINAVHIFNHLGADELVFLDIDATAKNLAPNLELIKNVGEEANMPFAVGGGIKSLGIIKAILNAGAERVILGTHAIENPDFIKKASDEFGSSSIVVCIDVKKTLFSGLKVYSKNARYLSKFNPNSFAVLAQELGAGEVIIQSVDNDGTMDGYNIELIRSISKSITIPVVALGGAGRKEDLETAYNTGYASGVAAGSYFVYQGSNKGVLISYPNKKDYIFSH